MFTYRGELEGCSTKSTTALFAVNEIAHLDRDFRINDAFFVFFPCMFERFRGFQAILFICTSNYSRPYPLLSDTGILKIVFFPRFYVCPQIYAISKFQVSRLSDLSWSLIYVIRLFSQRCSLRQLFNLPVRSGHCVLYIQMRKDKFSICCKMNYAKCRFVKVGFYVMYYRK